LSEQILAFQKSRALPQTAICDALTWKSLLEAGYHLGDRLLYVRTPMMRGEDVAELQNRLGSLGFDAGRVDGIFGQDTLRALKDFQRNVGLPIDGICGPTSVEELLRVFGRSSTNIHSVKELEHIRSDIRSLSDLSIAVSHQGFLDAPAELLRAALAFKGARAQVIMHPDPSRLASLSNAQEADLSIHIEEQPETQEIRYYQGFSYTSASGETLAHLVARYMNASSTTLYISVVGMNVPVLRETRMTAITISVGDPSFWVLHSPETALAVTNAISEWTNSDFRHDT
jgi:N-acetylmuramoyl-L-alanine amidase